MSHTTQNFRLKTNMTKQFTSLSRCRIQPKSGLLPCISGSTRPRIRNAPACVVKLHDDRQPAALAFANLWIRSTDYASIFVCFRYRLQDFIARHYQRKESVMRAASPRTFNADWRSINAARVRRCAACFDYLNSSITHYFRIFIMKATHPYMVNFAAFR
jgi:hypothetical protein